MRIERLNFRDFEPAASGGALAVRKMSLPGVRRKEEAPPPPCPPTFNEEQLKQAELESYKKGFFEGEQEGKLQTESQQADINLKLTETVEGFVKTIAPLLASYKAMVLQLRQDMPKVALAIAKKVAGIALDQNAQNVIDEMALACAETMIGEPKLSITVHSSLAESLEKKLTETSAKLQSASHYIITRDDNMALADCRIEWKYGAMERHTGQLWHQVEQVVGAMIVSAERTTTQQIEQLEQEIPAHLPKE